MKEEQARDAAWKKDRHQYRFDDGLTEPTIAKPCYFDGFDAALEYANRWTYLPELPTKTGWYLVTTTKTGTRTVNEALFKNGELLERCVIAWRPLPEAAEIKRSEDEV